MACENTPKPDAKGLVKTCQPKAAGPNEKGLRKEGAHGKNMVPKNGTRKS